MPNDRLPAFQARRQAADNEPRRDDAPFDGQSCQRGCTGPISARDPASFGETAPAPLLPESPVRHGQFFEPLLGVAMREIFEVGALDTLFGQFTRA